MIMQLIALDCLERKLLIYGSWVEYFISDKYLELMKLKNLLE